MALFKRKKPTNVLPEVEEYYQAERRDRAWLAWVLALVSVLVVVLIIIGLFWAGRWVYNQITDNDDSSDVSVVQNDDLTVDGTPTDVTESQDNGTESDSDDSQTDTSQGTVDAPAQTTTPSTGGQTTPTATPTTGDSELPDTGAGSLAGVFIGVTTLAGGIHYTVSRRRQGSN